MRRLLACLCFFIAVAIVAGCGGHSSYTIETDGLGSLRGMRTTPDHDEDNVEVDVTICVYWVEGYEPPAEFKFVLRDEGGYSVPTVKKAANDPNQWLFEPAEDLGYDTWYTIEVTSGDSGRSFTFRTEEEDRSVGLAGDSEAKKPEPGDSEPLLEHAVITGN